MERLRELCMRFLIIVGALVAAVLFMSFRGTPDSVKPEASVLIFPLAVFTQTDSEGDEASSNPFDGMGDMRVLREALEILGSADAQTITQEQQEALLKLGFTEEDLPELVRELRAFQEQEMIVIEGKEKVVTESKAAFGETALLWVFLSAAVVLLLSAVMLTIRFLSGNGKKRTRSIR